MQSDGCRYSLPEFLTLRRIVVILIVGFLFVSMTSSGVIGYLKNTDVEPSRGEDHGSDISESISEIAAQQDNYNETEPNDNRSNADRISTGSSVSGSGFINGSDVDWYAFNVTAGNAFNVAYYGQTVDVSVYGPAGNLIRSESAGTPDTWSVGGVADQSGTYYVRVTPDGGLGYGIAIKTAGPDQFEQNDDRSAAASIEPNQQLNPNLFAGEQDWYAVEADSGQTVTAVVERLSGALDPEQNLRVDIFNEDGELVSEPISNESFRISGENETIYSGGTISGSIAKVNVSDTQSGTYYVRISGVEELSGFIDYALTTNTGETTAPDEDVPDGLLDSNDNQSMAEQIDEGQRVEGMVGRYYLNESRIGVDPNIDTDVYVLNATAGQTINVSGSLASAFVSLSAPDGTVLANQAQRDIVNEAGTFNLSVVANKTGKYYVEFGFVDPSAPSDAALSGSYSVTYSISNDSGGPRSGGPSKTLTIQSTGSERVSYDFTVNGQVELGERANPVEATVPDSVSGSSASGSVAQNGVDDYRFSGNLTDISVDGPANVYVNGEQIETETGDTDTETPEPRIDANILDFSPESGTYRSGETQRAQVTVENTGNREHTFFVGYSISGPNDETFNNDDNTGRSVTLAAGEEKTVSVEWTVEDDIPAGTYDAITAVWKGSPGNLETNLDRTRKNSAFEVVEDTPDPRIDASILDFSPEGGTYRSGDTQRAQVTVENTGNREHTFFVGYTAIGPDDELFNNDDRTGRTVTLAAGETRTVPVEWTVEGDAPAGTYSAVTAIWKEDSGDLETDLDRTRSDNAFEVAGESSTDPETNNSEADQKPDINGTSLSIDPFPVPAGEAPTISVDVANATPARTDVIVNVTIDGVSAEIPMDHMDENRWRVDNLTDISDPDLSSPEPGTKVQLNITAENQKGASVLNETPQAFNWTELPMEPDQTSEIENKSSLHYYTFKRIIEVPVVMVKFENQELYEGDSGFTNQSQVLQWERAREYDINSYMGSSRGSMGEVGYELKYKDNNRQFYEIEERTEYADKDLSDADIGLVREIVARTPFKIANPLKRTSDYIQLLRDGKDAVGVKKPFIVTYPGPPPEFQNTKGRFPQMTPRTYPDTAPPRLVISMTARKQKAIGHYGTWIHELGHLTQGMWDLYSGPMRGGIRQGLMGGSSGSRFDVDEFKAGMPRGPTWLERSPNKPMLPAPFLSISRTVLNNNSWQTIDRFELDKNKMPEKTLKPLISEKRNNKVVVFDTTRSPDLMNNDNIKYVFEARAVNHTKSKEIVNIYRVRHSKDNEKVSNVQMLKSYDCKIQEYGKVRSMRRGKAVKHCSLRDEDDTREDVVPGGLGKTPLNVEFTLVEETGRYHEYRPTVKTEVSSGKSNSRTVTLTGTTALDVEYSGSSFVTNITKPDLDLKAVDSKGRIVGIDENGEYVNEIPGAEASGDRTQGMEWISVPENATVKYGISSTDVQRYINETNISATNVTVGYRLSNTTYGDNPQLEMISGNLTATNTTVNTKMGTLDPGETKAIAPVAASIRLSSEPVAGESATFTASGPDDSTTSYEWDFTGDGTIDATGNTVSHTFESNGPQVVSLSVSDDNGATDRVSKTIMVKASGDDPPSNDILSLITSPPAPTVITVAGFLTAILFGLAALSARYRS